MIRDEIGFALHLFFGRIIQLSHTMDMLIEGISGGGYPLSELVNNLLDTNSLIHKIKNDYTNDFHEFRLNGAGLKLYWRWVRNNNGFQILKLRIGGDQANQYPFFVAAVRRRIEQNRHFI